MRDEFSSAYFIFHPLALHFNLLCESLQGVMSWLHAVTGLA